jgi:hypothetical protein
VISRVCAAEDCGSAGVVGVALTAVFLVLSTITTADDLAHDETY